MSFTGVHTALVTPFKNNQVDYESLERLIEIQIEAKVDGIVAVGTTGESPTLNVKEHSDVIKFIIRQVAQRCQVIAGTGGNATDEAIELTVEAFKNGADGSLQVTPYYNKPTQEGLFQHFKLIAESVSIDQILYNVPGRTAVDMSVDTTSRLSEISNIIGIKDATGDLSVIKQLVVKCPEDFLLLTGDDATAIDFILLGGHGGISVTANVTPNELQKAYLAAIAGNAELANQLNEALSGLHKNLFIESNPIPVKWALHKMGMCDRGIRLPLLELSKQCRVVLENDLKELGLI